MNFRSLRAVQTDITQIPMTSSSHDCGSLSRVIMVRKTDQRMINHKKPEAVSPTPSYAFHSKNSYFIGNSRRTQNVNSSRWKRFKRTKDTNRTEPLCTPKNMIWSNQKLKSRQALNVFCRELQTPSTMLKMIRPRRLSNKAAKRRHQSRMCADHSH